MADVSYRDVLARPGVRQALVINQLGYKPGTKEYTNAVSYLGLVAKGKRSGEKSAALAAAVDAAKTAAARENETGAGGIVTVGGTGRGGTGGRAGDTSGFAPVPESFYFTGTLRYNGKTEVRGGSEMRMDMVKSQDTRDRIEALWREIQRETDSTNIDRLYDEIWEEIFEELTGYEATRG